MKTINETINEAMKTVEWSVEKHAGFGKYSPDCEFVGIDPDENKITFWSKGDIEDDEDLYLDEGDIKAILSLKVGEVHTVTPGLDWAFLRIK